MQFVVQWLKLCPSNAGVWSQSLVRELGPPTCHGVWQKKTQKQSMVFSIFKRVSKPSPQLNFRMFITQKEPL